MLIKLKMYHDQHGPGDVVEMNISTARKLISDGRAVLLSTQEQPKAAKSPDNKMVTNNRINNKGL
jgi:hypothetical protein